MKRKKLTSAASPPPEVPSRPTKRPNKDSFYAEEELAQPKEPSECVVQYKAHCSRLREIATEIYEAKLAKKTRSELADFMMPLMQMKELNRVAQFRLKSFREMTQEKKVQIDQHHLKLQNLMYEVMHLEKEISRCLEFRSKHEDIPLVSTEEFYAGAPPDISRPDLTMNDEHAQTLARLSWELEQRKELAKQLKAADESIDVVRKEIQSKKDFLNGLLPKLKEITETTKPVQEYMNIPFNKEIEQNSLAVLLPSPLYTLFTEVKAYSIARDPSVTLSVEGDAEEARLVRPQLLEARFGLMRPSGAPGEPSRGGGDISEEEAESGAEGEASGPVAGDGGPSSDRAADKRSGTPGSRKEKGRHRRRGSKSVRSVEEEALNSLLKLHPLTVVVCVNMKGGAVLRLQFCYAMALKVVTVKIALTLPLRWDDDTNLGTDLLSPEKLLSHLYPGDSGYATGLHVLRQEMRRARVGSLWEYAPRLGIPYVWAQRLSGLDLLPTISNTSGGRSCRKSSSIREQSGLDISNIPGPDLDIAFDHSVECFARIKRRVSARLALIRELAAIDRNEWRLTDSQQKLVPLRLHCRLRGWKKMSFEDIQLLPNAQKFLKEDLAQEFDCFFMGTIERDTPPRCRATVHTIIPVDYPAETPISMLSLSHPTAGGSELLHSANCLQIQELETTVNCYLSEFALDREWTPGNGLIACQLQRLLSCFDVLMESEWTNRNEDGITTVDRRSTKNIRVLRPAKYPSRRMPYKYSEAFDTFVQR